MTEEKRVTKRGSRRSLLLGVRDPRHRRDAQEQYDPKADEKEAEIERRLKALEKERE